jgi:cyclic-di-GMP phosphodiesterase TipF (flagellum assembly factor)
MGKSATVFVALCMVTVAVSLAIISMSGFGLALGDAMFVGIGSLAIFGLIQAVFTRRGLEEPALPIDTQRTHRDLWDRIQTIEERLAHHEALMRDSARVVVEPVSEEIAELGILISQLAEQIESHEHAIGDLRKAPAPVAQQPAEAPARAAVQQGFPAEGRLASWTPSLLNGVHHDPLQAAVSELRADQARRAPDVRPDAAPSIRIEPEPVMAAPEPMTAPDLTPAAAQAPRRPAPQRPAAAPDHSNSVDVEAVRRALAEDRIEIHLQPIVALPQRRVLFYEAGPRLRDVDGRTRMPMEFLPAARAGGLVPAIDRFVIERGLMIAERLRARGRDLGLFVAISPATLVDDTAFQALAGVLDQWRDQAARVVLTLRQESIKTLGALEHETLKSLTERGFRFGLDHVTDLAFDARALHALGIRYAKVAADVILNPGTSVNAEIHPADLPGLLKRHGIAFIASRVETESTVADLLDLDIAHAQGLLFGPPRPVRTEIFSETRPAQAPAPAPVALQRGAVAGGSYRGEPEQRPAARNDRFEPGLARRSIYG